MVKRLKKIDKPEHKLNTVKIMILIYSLAIIVEALIFYPLIPIIFNYGPGFIETGNDVKTLGISYTLQYFVIMSIFIVGGILFLLRVLKGIEKWPVFMKQDTQEANQQVLDIRRRCLTIPFMIYLGQILLLASVVLGVELILGFPILLIIKQYIVIFSFTTLAAIASLLLSKSILVKVLEKTYKNESLQGIRIGLRTKIIIQILPMFMVAVLFTSLIGYSRLVEDKGKLIFEIYKARLINEFRDIEDINNIKDIKNKLEKMPLRKKEDSAFIVDPKNNVIALNDSEFSPFFLNYMFDLSPVYNGRIHDIIGEIQGSIYYIDLNNKKWGVGVKYEVASMKTITFFIFTFAALLLLNFVVLFYVSKSISNDISLVANSLTGIAEGENVDLDKKIPVTSNDEIGDLVVAFNKIQRKMKENIQALNKNHEIIMEQERMATLGQLIGGIAHNMNTPIMSIAGGTRELKELVIEYKDSLDDKSVTKEDHVEITQEMNTWLDKIKGYCAYMSDMIRAVKGQAVQMSASLTNSFTLDELVKRIDLLMNHQLKTNLCTMDKNIKVSLNTEIKGEINNLIQVLSNLINNAIQSYEGKGGKIDFTIKDNKDNIVLSIKDSGKGITDDIKEKIFKEMITTKGKYGTGLGVYMSFVTIKGRFAGDMWFDTIPGKGTTFYVSIPR